MAESGYTEHMSSISWNPKHRFQRFELEWEVPPPSAKLEIIEDHGSGILQANSSPDLPFRWSLNPYRGCTHACAYCYARAFHELLELGAGTDFERKIIIKPRAADLLRQRLMQASWRGERIAFSGVTDCYQPIERRYGLTRACLEVCAEFRNPVVMVTRSPLILRDLDLLESLAQVRALEINISIPILDPKTARALEPGAPPPEARLRAISALSEAGIPVGVSLAPLIPGINDHAIPATLEAAKEAGASWAWTQLVRLSQPVAAVFERRLTEALPHRAASVMARIRRARGGQLNDRDFQTRMQGVDATWAMADAVFKQWRSRLGMSHRPGAPVINPFRRPGQGHQLGLFADPD